MTYVERTPNVYLRIPAYDHTLAYADVIRCSVTALLVGHGLQMIHIDLEVSRLKVKVRVTWNNLKLFKRRDTINGV